MKSGQEIVDNEMYTLIDKGDRRVALRPEMTPTVSRMVAGKRQELGYPLRWYSIPNLLRYERPQRGRLREHWQLNIDIFGVGTIEAEHEVIMLADQIMKAFGAKRSMYEFRINSRKFINYVLGEYLGLDEVESFTVAKLIDRIHKIDRAKFIAMVEIAISPSLRDKGTIDKLMEILDVSDIASLPNAVKSHETLAWLVQLMKLLSDAGVICYA